MALRIIGRRPALLLERDPRRVGIDGRPGPVAPEVIELGPDDPPVAPVVVERARRQGEHLPLLCVVQHPVQILVDRQVG